MGAPQSQTQNPQTTTGQFVFDVPDPGSSAVLYRLTGKATIEFVDPAWGTTLTRPVSVFYIQPSALRGWLDVVWSGVDSWREINIAWAPIWEAGVHVDSVFCFVLAADG